jgi:hypothetical protein
MTLGSRHCLARKMFILEGVSWVKLRSAMRSRLGEGCQLGGASNGFRLTFLMGTVGEVGMPGLRSSVVTLAFVVSSLDSARTCGGRDAVLQPQRRRLIEGGQVRVVAPFKGQPSSAVSHSSVQGQVSRGPLHSLCALHRRPSSCAQKTQQQALSGAHRRTESLHGGLRANQRM